jgi:hypothetical protein
MMKGMDEDWMKSEGGEVCVHVTRDRECDVISNSKKRSEQIFDNDRRV